MRLSIRLEDDLYAAARALAREDDCSITRAVNKLLRRALEPPSPTAIPADPDGLPTVACRRRFSSDDVRRAEAEDDRR